MLILIFILYKISVKDQETLKVYDKVLMNLAYCAISGDGQVKNDFLEEAKRMQIERNGKLHQNNAKGIFTYFKLYDDDIWIGLANKYKEYFVFK